jgi:hypothetical protein
MLIYLRCPTLIQKQVSKNTLFFAVGITFSLLMFQIYTHFTSKNQKVALGGWAEWLRRVLPRRKVSCSNPGVDKFILIMLCSTVYPV